MPARGDRPFGRVGHLTFRNVFGRLPMLVPGRPLPVPATRTVGNHRGAAPRPVRDGQSLVEFAFILLLIALGCIASVIAFGTALDGYYAAIVSGLPF